MSTSSDRALLVSASESQGRTVSSSNCFVIAAVNLARPIHLTFKVTANELITRDAVIQSSIPIPFPRSHTKVLQCCVKSLVHVTS